MSDKQQNNTPRILVSGGGTGGHIFPALSIANAMKRRYPGAEILFVGALGRMEMERVPAAGYEIIGLPVAGFDRRRLWRNFKVIAKLLRSMRIAKKVLRDFRPDIAVGVGGYASGPMLKAAQKAGIPTPTGFTLKNGQQTVPSSGAELLCRSDQQAAGKESRIDLRGL